MKNFYAKVIVKGSPISKSNFKLFSMQGRAILPFNSGKYYDRYAIYEQQIAYEARAQNPGVTFTESLISILKVYYKSQKRHPDTNNITKSIFDGIEKSGLIINDAQIRRLIIEENYDKKNPRFELELYAESLFQMSYEIKQKSSMSTPVEYSLPPNVKSKMKLKNNNTLIDHEISDCCQICGKPVNKNDCISADHGKILICKNCFNKLF